MKHLSIRWQMIAPMLLLAMALLAMVIAATYFFQDIARQSWVKGLSGELERASAKVRMDMTELGVRAATGVKKTPHFRSGFQELKAQPDSSRQRTKFQKLLGNGFHQKVISTGKLKVLGFRVYTKDLDFLAQKLRKEAPPLPKRMDPAFRERAGAREGSARLKPTSFFGKARGTPYHAVLTPIGGLGVIGYLEVLIKPVHSLRRLNSVMGLPVAIESAAGSQLYTSQEWQEADSGSDNLVADYTLRTDDGRPALIIHAEKDISDLEAHFANASSSLLMLAVGVTILGSILVYGFMTRFVTKPLGNTVSELGAAQEALDVTEKFSGEDRGNEIGQLRRGWNSFVRTLAGILRTSRSELALSRGLSQSVSQKLDNVHQSAEEANQKVDQVVHSAEEVNEVVQGVANNIQEVSQSASHSSDKTREGMKALDQAAERVEGLQSASYRVNEITDTIQNIAKKTDLLALNAAIEAANAGEAGKGFAVVADEVRKLAEQTSQATDQVNEVVREFSGEAKASVAAMQEVQGQIGEVEKMIGDTDERANQIAASAEELAATMSETTESVSGIRDDTATVTNAVAEVQMAALQLQDSGDAMEARFNLFRLNESEVELDGSAHELMDAKLAHINWRTRLIRVLQGEEALSEEEVASHEHCQLGRWIYSDGLDHYGHLEAMRALEDVHRNLHGKIREVVGHYNNGDTHQAYRGYQEFVDLAKQVLERLDDLATHVQG